MNEIYIYGLGKGKKALDRCLLYEDVSIIAYIDNYKADGNAKINDIPIISIDQIENDDAPIIITLMQYKDIRAELIKKGISEGRLISFYDFYDADNEGNWVYIDSHKWRTELMWKHYTEVTIPTVDNLGYEIYAEELQAHNEIPTIVSAYDTVKKIIEERKCLARFGDNEFELLLGRRRTNYQTVNGGLSERLREVLQSNMDNLVIAIADNYGKLDRYTESAAAAIRQYLGSGTRAEHMQLLDLKRTYYDAYLSRPYMIYKDRKGAKERFEHIRKLWDNREVLIVEGEHTRFGVGNDLLNNAKSVDRILTLDKDCFNVYDNLLDKVKSMGKNKLIMIILGPVATIMAHDLAKEGYWAVDIGQLDVEYEWYLRQVQDRCDIPYKTVSEVQKYDEIDSDYNKTYMKTYRNEIVEVVKE